MPPSGVTPTNVAWQDEWTSMIPLFVSIRGSLKCHDDAAAAALRGVVLPQVISVIGKKRADGTRPAHGQAHVHGKTVAPKGRAVHREYTSRAAGEARIKRARGVQRFMLPRHRRFRPHSDLMQLPFISRVDTRLGQQRRAV